MCNECGKSLQSRNGLYVHLKVHRGEKNHQCQMCGNKYVTSGELKSHMRHIHSSDKPFVCPFSGCRKAFVSKGPLQQHLCSHLTDKLFMCHECDKALASPSSLRQHMIMHRGIRPKRCSICSKRFHNMTVLQQHMDDHAKNLIGVTLAEVEQHNATSGENTDD